MFPPVRPLVYPCFVYPTKTVKNHRLSCAYYRDYEDFKDALFVIEFGCWRDDNRVPNKTCKTVVHTPSRWSEEVIFYRVIKKEPAVKSGLVFTLVPRIKPCYHYRTKTAERVVIIIDCIFLSFVITSCGRP